MRKIIVRFRNNEDLDKLGTKIHMNLNVLTKEVNMKESTQKFKKSVSSRGMKKIDWKNEWNDMPEFNENFKNEVYVKADFLFDDDETVEEMGEIFEQKITDRTTSIWYPKLKFGLYRTYRVIGGENPVYPVYVISKNRAEYESWHTSFRFSQISVKHYLVVEPQEYESYCKVFNNEYVEVLKMDMTYKDTYDCFSDLGNKDSTGAGAVRNFCWDHSMKNGFKWHWVFDDNIDGFNRFWRGKRLICRTGEALRSCERFIERYDNIGIAGLNYSKFCKSGDKVPPYVLNTRIYSMLLIKNDIPFRWRGRYNEDTDLSLRVLKAGLCTIQFNLFLGEKRTTQMKKGGNTEEFYSKEGTMPKSQMLVDMHPDVAKLVYRFNRWHHYVDYSIFKQKLKPKEGIPITKDDDEFGMRIVKIPDEICTTKLDTKEYIEQNFDIKENRIDNTNFLL